jgi:two-component system, NtrC family, sensor kinase
VALARQRATLWVEVGVSLALLTVAVSVFDAGVFSFATRYVLREASVDIAEGAAVVIAGQAAAAPPSEWPTLVAEHRKRGLRGLAIWSPRDDVTAGESGEIDALAKRTLASREVYSEIEGDEVRVVAPVGSGRPTAVVTLRYPLATVERPAWLVVAGHALFSSTAIGLFGWFLFRRNLVEPIQRIGAATRRIADGEFDAPVPADAPRELAELADALGRMGVALASYRTRTAEQLESLERANRELKQAQDALVRTEKLAGLGRLAAGLAHELGNPLSAVRGYLELLGPSQHGGENDEILRRARVDVERMHRLLRNLLDYARGEDDLPGDVELATLLEEAARTVQHQVVFRGVALAVTHDPSVSSVRGEPAKLHQVLVNLLLNAAEAGAGKVQLSSGMEEESPFIRVSDDGEGITPENLARLFEPFFTTRAPGLGTGLGLATAFRIMEQHGGRLDVTSTAGEGSHFTCWFPAER